VQNADQIERVGNLGDPVDALFFEATSDEQRFFLVRDGVLSNQRFYSGRLIDIRFMRTARSPVAFSIDQNVIASGSAGQDILFWSSNLGQSEVVIPMEGDLTALTFNANGMLLAAGDENGDILIWNVFTREERARLHMGGAVRALIFEQHSDSLIVASMGNPIRIYEGEEIKVEIPVVGLVSNLAISPDGHFLAYNDDERVYLYDLEAGREYDHLETHEEAVNAVAFSADGLLLAAGDSGGSIAIIDAANMTLLQTLSVTPRHAVRQVDFNAFRGQSTVLAVVDDTGNASFWGIVEATE
jgi:WD40 repeat protein